MQTIINICGILVFIGSLVAALNLKNKVKNKTSKEKTLTEPLSKKEKYKIWILCLLAPIVAGAIFYYGWIKEFPIKAKSANKISWTAFAILVVVSYVASLAGIQI